MKQINTYLKTATLALCTLLLASCGSKKSELEKSKEELAKLKTEQQNINKKINDLEQVIAKLDTSKKVEKSKLVSLQPVTEQEFKHYIDLQGKVESVNVGYVAPKGMGGQVKAILVKRGDAVSKGQVLLKLDDVLAQQNVKTAQQSLEVTKTQLALAKTVYNKQKSLWEQNIGTEVQYLSAKSNYETLDNQLKTQKEQLQLAKDQLGFTDVKAEMAGVIDDLNVRVGEFFNGAGQIKIVNADNLKVTTQVPENYLGKVVVGTPAIVNLPDMNKTISSQITVVGKLIDPLSRSFFTEIKLNETAGLKPNQVAVVQICDYTAPKAIVVPVNVLQSDEKGKFIMVAEKVGNKYVAKKRLVVMGALYGDKLEIKSGLKAGDVIISEGYQTVYEGQVVSTEPQQS